MYYVYIHTSPNGKIYIGKAKDLMNRWNNGEGYNYNKNFYKDIQAFGWNNIKHEIIGEFADREEALRLESVLIALMKSENPDYGYNQTNILDRALKLYASRVRVNNILLETPVSEEGFFEQTGLPRTACENLIEQWIFNEKHRNIVKRRLLDGLKYEELGKEFNLSIRQLKNVVYSCCNQLAKHI